MGLPDPGTTRPSLAAFAEAQDRKRLMLGSPVTFLWEPEVTFAPATAMDMDGKPLDPTVQPASATQASASATASVFFKAINRGGASNADIASQFGHEEKTRLFLNLASGDGLLVKGEVSTWNGQAFAGAGSPAAEFVHHGERFKIYAIKDDEIVLGYLRTLVYGAAIGASDASEFEP